MLRGRGNIGQYDVLLTFEQPTSAANSIGENEQTWSTYRAIYGKRIWKGSGEKYESHELTATDQISVKTIYDSAIDTTMRFRQGTETTYFYVRNVQQWQREGYLIIEAVRRDSQ